MRAMLLLATAASAAALAQGCSSDKPVGPVIDRADLLPPEAEARLNRELRDYFEKTGRALVVATTPSLGGQKLESYAFEMFNRLGIGSAKTNQGLLLLVAPAERMARIEVGRGLETTVTNARAARIMDEAIIPRFKTGDFTGGIDEGVDALIAATESGLAYGVAALCPHKVTP